MSFRTCKSLAVGAALLLIGACTDLTVEPKSTVTEANIFNDLASYRAFIGKVYAGLAVGGQSGGDGRTDIQGIDGGFSQYIRLYWEHQELPSDDAIIAWGDAGLSDLISDNWSASNPFVNAMYYRIYFQVGMANEFLRQTTDEKLASRGQTSATLKAEVAQYRAEARFLRALSYWHGVDLFGPIPLVTVNDPIAPTQSTRQEVYNFIVSDLIAIQPDLPSAGPGTYGRATKEAASMLLAQVYLNAEVYTGTPHYTEALAAASAVIAGPFSLDPSYDHLFQADNNTSPEIVFPLVQDGIHSQGYGGTTFLIHASCGNSMDPSDYGVNGCWYGLRLKPEAYNRSAADPRGSYFYTNNQTVAIASLTNFGDGIPAPKFSNKTSTGGTGSDTEFPDTDFPMFRLGDAYLIYAEAAVRTNTNLGQALTYVNDLRQRAYGDNSGDITAPELTLPFLLDERGRELLWEAHRRTDLVRYGLFTGGGYIWSWKGNVQAGQATDAHLDLYPIPASQLSANPNLKQNPQY